MTMASCICPCPVTSVQWCNKILLFRTLTPPPPDTGGGGQKLRLMAIGELLVVLWSSPGTPQKKYWWNEVQRTALNPTKTS